MQPNVISYSQSGTLLIVSNTHIRTIAECCTSVYVHIGIVWGLRNYRNLLIARWADLCDKLLGKMVSFWEAFSDKKVCLLHTLYYMVHIQQYIQYIQYIQYGKYWCIASIYDLDCISTSGRIYIGYRPLYSLLYLEKEEFTLPCGILRHSAGKQSLEQDSIVVCDCVRLIT